jgi:hypothetical protein
MKNINLNIKKRNNKKTLHFQNPKFKNYLNNAIFKE